VAVPEDAQQTRPVSRRSDAAADDIADGILAPVIDLGPIFTPDDTE
jgi:hypothetical protein